LLVVLVLAFAARPVIGDPPLAVASLSIALLAILFIALYTVQVEDLLGDRDALLVRKKRTTRLAWLLVVPAVAERVVVIVAPSHRLYLLSSVSWLLFLSFVTWTQAQSLLRQRRITSETLSMAISVYLLLAITWGMLFIAIFEFNPGAFSFGASRDGAEGPSSGARFFPVLLYFSLTTIATVGYGDVLPVSMGARYAAVAEGIAGQLYLAILVARLVSMQVSGAAAQGNAAEPGRGDPTNV